MNTTDVKETVEQILRLLEQTGMSAKTMKKYRQSGFGVIIRYFARHGGYDVTDTMLDAFVREKWLACERKKLSVVSWRIVRRSSELIQHYIRTGTVNMPALRPWNPVLRKTSQSVAFDTPTHEQLANPDDLFALIWRVRQELQQKGLTQKTIRHYTAEGLSIILSRHNDLGLECYSEEIASAMVAERYAQYKNGHTSRIAYQNLRKASCLLSEMYHTGKITLAKLPVWGQREPNPEYANLLQHFCDNARRTGAFSAATINCVRSAVRNFSFELESLNIISFYDVTLTQIGDVITKMSKRYKGGLRSILFSIRIFLKHLSENGFSKENLSLAIPETTARRKTFREGFSGDEIMQLLKSTDVSTSIGKRDYAILLLAAQTGLRACDVVMLKRKDINWRVNEICIVQQKTGKPLSLPLEPESGNAIADYLLFARPKSDLPYIFLCHPGEKRPINNRSASGIVSRYLKRANITSVIPRRGFHSFRRAFGTRLLQYEIPLELLRQLLGHSKMDSLKPYLSVNEQGLKQCALGLIGDGKAGELV